MYDCRNKENNLGNNVRRGSHKAAENEHWRYDLSKIELEFKYLKSEKMKKAE